MKTGLFMDRTMGLTNLSMKTWLFMDRTMGLMNLSMKTGLFMDGYAGLGILSMNTGLFMDRMTRLYKKKRMTILSSSKCFPMLEIISEHRMMRIQILERIFLQKGRMFLLQMDQK